jgi:hypothetical protein
MNASHIPNGTITALLAMVLVYFFPLASSAARSADGIRLCRSTRRPRRRHQILQIQDSACRGPGRASRRTGCSPRATSQHDMGPH